MAMAKAASKLRGRRPKLTALQEKRLVQLHRTGAHAMSEIAELFDVARSRVYRAIKRVSLFGSNQYLGLLPSRHRALALTVLEIRRD
jgi:predicted DNA-binding protein YlxM (UPF0122 family)